MYILTERSEKVQMRRCEKGEKPVIRIKENYKIDQENATGKWERWPPQRNE